MALECELVSYDPSTGRMVGRIVNVSAEESILDESGKIDPDKLKPIVFDPVRQMYRKLGDVAGHAFSEGQKLK